MKYTILFSRKGIDDTILKVFRKPSETPCPVFGDWTYIVLTPYWNGTQYRMIRIRFMDVWTGRDLRVLKSDMSTIYPATADMNSHIKDLELSGYEESSVEEFEELVKPERIARIEAILNLGGHGVTL